MSRLLITIYILSLAPIGFSADQYVSDVLYVPVRTGASQSHKIVGYLKSGDKVASIGSQDDYSQIRSLGGKRLEGWVKSRYLLSEPVAKVKLKVLQADLKRIGDIKTQLSSAKVSIRGLEKDKQQLTDELNSIRSASANAIQLDEDNRSLKKELDSLKSELDRFKDQNLLLERNQRNEGIKLGILAIALGALVGFILPLLKPRLKRRTSSVRLR